ncbi:anaerobic ribonucleoside-triphosphate reductase-activating protein [Anaerocolumna cellulosilytica]|uniref:Anaerobic ribonucleoside-triphosphate reductase-activating protein n=1 Tax=Anaerocolumna cellulosilytica TaxID=433286 RepID=A0A6S6R6A5_9FIRM|nr:anaerobic ribonucleoside-triphosphate reductase activating protein [Anaerocolumna cellulosilytica]MBB5195869.1 anaerobic ribonucleoside-triphosphate reductase activating protein [Anaerocolumna cellulosilytica]BCJ96879.1 anaerobic ribonucleoside-triphosphate reductase-activating protein [Anaerocolumna cellulosilytica]
MHYHNITKDDMLNGTGLRVVLWVAGCTHGCKGCQNPVTWDLMGGLPFDEAAKDELFKELDKTYIEGITFSGGDPLHPANRQAVGALIEEIRIRFPKKNIWVYTGFEWEELTALSFLPQIDVLVDGKFCKELLNPQLHWKGSSNQRVIDVKKTLNNNTLTIL